MLPFLLLACASPQQSRESFRDCAECPEMVTLPAGEFTMGAPPGEGGREANEGPQRIMRIPAAFAVSRSEITRGQYAVFVRMTGHAAAANCNTSRNNDGRWRADGDWRDPGFAQTDDHPVVCVNWEDAHAYVSWLNARTGGGYRLLSEAEWEYAARAGSKAAFSWGDEGSHDLANYGAAVDSCCRGLAAGRDQWLATAPARSFPPNAFGLYDLHGNAWEWAQDCYTDDLSALPGNATAHESPDCRRRQVRGGSWIYFPFLMRSANRGGDEQGVRGADLGFRIAKTLAPPAQR